MVRKVFKSLNSEKINSFLIKYKIPTEFFSINRILVARAVMLGIFFALLPIPTQILFLILTSSLIRFNIVIALSIVLLTNPLTMPFVILAEYQLGSLLLHQEAHLTIEPSMEWLMEHYDGLIMPLLVGSLSAAFVLSISAFFIVNFLWIRSVKKADVLRKNRV